MNKIKWELVVAVLGLIFAGLSFFRDLTGYEVKTDEKGKFYPTERSIGDMESKPEKRIADNHYTKPTGMNPTTGEADVVFPFDTITISKGVSLSASNNGILTILEREKPLPFNGKQTISSVVPIRDIVKFVIFSYPVPKKNTIFSFSLNDNTESQVFQTDNFFNETLFLQFIKYKVVRHNKNIKIDRKVIKENPIWTLLFISCLFLPVLVRFVIENIFGGKYKSRHGFIAIFLGLILAFIGYTIDVIHQMN